MASLISTTTTSSCASLDGLTVGVVSGILSAVDTSGEDPSGRGVSATGFNSGVGEGDAAGVTVPALLQGPPGPSCEYPTSHWQWAAAVLPAGELELAGHDEHVQLLLLDRYSPAPQSLHDGAAWTWYVQSAEVLTVP